MSSDSATFEVKEVANDGNSFYRSISYLVFGVTDRHALVRKAMYRYMIDTRNDHVLDKRCREITGTPNIKTYVLRNSTHMEGGEACEMVLHIAAVMLQTSIYVLDSEIKKKPKLYRPDGFRSKRALVLQRVEIDGKPHFQPVVMYNKCLKHDKPKPPTSDEEYHESVSADDYCVNTADEEDETTTSESRFDTVTEDEESESEDSTVGELFVDRELAPVRYRYVPGQAEDSAEMLVTFDSDEGKSKRENVDAAVAAVFREKRRPRMRLQSFIVGPEGSGKITEKNVLNEWNYSVLSEILNRHPKLFNTKGMFAHFKRVLRKTPLFELKDSVALSNTDAENIKNSFARMRSGLMPFKTSFVYREGKNKEVSGTLRYACLAFPRSDRRGFAYYHSQRHNAKWSPLPVNPHVYEIAPDFQPRKTLAVGDKVYALVGKKLVIVSLFGTEDVESFKLPCKKHDERRAR